jgi:hypothetical protein
MKSGLVQKLISNSSKPSEDTDAITVKILGLATEILLGRSVWRLGIFFVDFRVVVVKIKIVVKIRHFLLQSISLSTRSCGSSLIGLSPIFHLANDSIRTQSSQIGNPSMV